MCRSKPLSNQAVEPSFLESLNLQLPGWIKFATPSSRPHTCPHSLEQMLHSRRTDLCISAWWMGGKTDLMAGGETRLFHWVDVREKWWETMKQWCFAIQNNQDPHYIILLVFPLNFWECWDHNRPSEAPFGRKRCCSSQGLQCQEPVFDVALCLYWHPQWPPQSEGRVLETFHRFKRIWMLYIYTKKSQTGMHQHVRSPSHMPTFRISSFTGSQFWRLYLLLLEECKGPMNLMPTHRIPWLVPLKCGLP